MMKANRLSVALFIVAATSTVFAQEAGSVVFSNIAQKEVISIDESGNELAELAGVGIVLPGDTVVYTSTFTNEGDEPVSDIVVNNPVPANTEYLGFSARGENTQVVFSVDGGNVFASPAELTLVGENGEERTALPKEYTDIRWIYSGELLPDQSSSVSFKVRIP